MAELREFLAELAADAERLGRFIQDPEAVMKEAKLSDKDREALRSGFANVIYARLSGVDLEEAFGMSLRPTQLPQNLFQQVPVQFQPLQIMPQLPPQITLQLPRSTSSHPSTSSRRSTSFPRRSPCSSRRSTSSRPSSSFLRRSPSSSRRRSRCSCRPNTSSRPSSSSCRTATSSTGGSGEARG